MSYIVSRAFILFTDAKDKRFILFQNKTNVTILSRTSHPVSGFPAVFHFMEGSLFGDPENTLHDVRSQRWKSSLTRNETYK